jgi:pantetheine-phosphate adenylyltransferase
VRGVRNSSDFEYELQISNTNLILEPQIKTVLLTPKPENSFISSTVVREIYKNGGDISKLVPYVW